MALLRGKLLAGALFAGTLFGPQPVDVAAAGTGGPDAQITRIQSFANLGDWNPPTLAKDGWRPPQPWEPSEAAPPYSPTAQHASLVLPKQASAVPYLERDQNTPGLDPVMDLARRRADEEALMLILTLTQV